MDDANRVSSDSAQTDALVCDWPDCTSDGQWNPCTVPSWWYASWLCQEHAERVREIIRRRRAF